MMALSSIRPIISAVADRLNGIVYPDAPQSTTYRRIVTFVETGDQIGAALTKTNQNASEGRSTGDRKRLPSIGIGARSVRDPGRNRGFDSTFELSETTADVSLLPAPMLCNIAINVYTRKNYELDSIWAQLQFKLHRSLPLEVGTESELLRLINIVQRPNAAVLYADAPQAIFEFSVPYFLDTTEDATTVNRHTTFTLYDDTVIIGENDG